MLDVVPTKPKSDVLLLQAPQDEAASDPPSSVAGEPAGGIGGGITPEGGSVMSTDSPEMLPDAEMENASQVVELEGYMLRRVVGTSHPTNHEDEIEIEGLEVDLPIESMEQDYEKGLEGQSVEDHEELPWKGRTYEEGPPQLSQQELEELDRRMDDVEYTRLEKMGVLRPMQREEDGKGMVCLKSKTVRDWRFRGEWRRRSRLVAKEFRHLQPALEDLYAPASLGILQKLLAGLCVTRTSSCTWLMFPMLTLWYHRGDLHTSLPQQDSPMNSNTIFPDSVVGREIGSCMQGRFSRKMA